MRHHSLLQERTLCLERRVHGLARTCGGGRGGGATVSEQQLRLITGPVVTTGQYHHFQDWRGLRGVNSLSLKRDEEARKCLDFVVCRRMER